MEIGVAKGTLEFEMRSWFYVVSFFTKVIALRLHSGTVTPLQLTFKIADSEHFQEATGVLLMESLDVLKCFDAIAHLLSIRTLKFRTYFKQTCSRRFDFDVGQVNGKYIIQRNLVLTEMMGMDCLSQVENYGRIFAGRPVLGATFNSWTTMASFSNRQVRAMLNYLVSPREKDDLLFTGFLDFKLVVEDGAVRELYKHARILFDGPFCEYNTRHALSIAPLFLGVIIDEGRIVSASSFDITDVSVEDYTKLKANLADPRIAIDFISRFIQLTAAHVYTSSVMRTMPNVPTLRLIKDVTLLLAPFTLMHSRYFDPWTTEVKAAVSLSKSIMTLDVVATDFKMNIFKAGYVEEHHFFDMICRMTEQIVTYEVVNQEWVDMITRLKVETLVVLNQFQVSAAIMMSHVKSILHPRKFQRHRQKPRCRHLIVLLWALSKDKNTHDETCRLILGYILENMSPNSEYFEVLKKLSLLKFLPFAFKLREARKKLTGQLNSYFVDEVIGSSFKSDSAFLTKLPHTSLDGIDFTAPNGYLHVNLMRHALKNQIISMLRSHLVYCGHINGLPAYIQSLTCHLSISALFQLQLMFGSILRLKIPFVLHPHLMRLIAKPDDKEYAAEYLYTAVQHELINLPRSTVNPKLPQILMLLEQTKYRLLNPEDIKRGNTNYENLISRLYKYRMIDRTMPEEKIIQLRDGLFTFGTSLISNTVMKTCFISMYEIPGISLTEGFAILLNQSPDK